MAPRPLSVSSKEEQLYGRAECRVAPRGRGDGAVFRHEVESEPPVPEPIVEAAMQGLRDAAQSGPGGYPLEDIEVVLESVDFRPEAQPEVGVRAATAEAVRKAVASAGPFRLEPIMELEVLAPEEALGGVIGDLNARSGHIL